MAANIAPTRVRTPASPSKESITSTWKAKFPVALVEIAPEVSNAATATYSATPATSKASLTWRSRSTFRTGRVTTAPALAPEMDIDPRVDQHPERDKRRLTRT